MRKQILLSALLLVQVTLFSQKEVTVSGVVTEKNSRQALEFATIVLLNPLDSVIVTGGITDELGNYHLQVAPGIYTLRAEFIGFQKITIENLHVDTDTEIPAIELEQDAAQLDAVLVTGEQSTIEYKLDKRVFNVGKDITSKGGSANEVLSNVPSVAVDASGEVSLRGNSSVRILINGKPSVLTNNGGLETIPAETIESVEVITNPSSKYNAEGTAGIINIILKKNNRSGFSSTLNLTAGIPDDQSVNYNVNYKTEKFNLFSNIRYSYREYEGYGNSERFNLSNGTVTSVLKQNVETLRSRNIFNLYFGGDYYFNDKNTFTLSYYYRNNVSENDVDYSYRELDSDGVLSSISEATEFYREPQIANQIELNHVKDFAKEGQRLTFNLQYDFWNDDENEYIDQQEMFPLETSISKLRSRDVESSDDFIFQSDFTLPIADNQTVELGIQGEIREITSDYGVWENEAILDSLTNYLVYNEKIYGAYAQYGNSKHRLNYQLGLRAEYADTESEDPKGEFETSKQYLKLFPTAHLTYKIKETSNVQLSYSRRIRRPRFWQLNPFGGISDTRNIRIGNPDLNPMYTNSFELAWLRRWDKLTLNPSVYHQHTINLFQTSVELNEADVLVSQNINAGAEDIIGIELVTSYSPYKWLRLSHEVNYYQFDQKGLYTVSGHSLRSRLNSNFKFAKFSAQASIDYRAPWKSGPFEYKSRYWSSMGVSTDLWKDKASIAVNARNVFNSRIHSERAEGADYIIDGEYVWSGRRVSATFTYRFNRTKQDRDRMPD